MSSAVSWRGFVALPIPAAIVESWRCGLLELPAWPASLRPLLACDWHVTLTFFSKAPCDLVMQAWRRLLEQELGAAIRLCACSVGGLPLAQPHARVVFLQLSEGLLALHRRVQLAFLEVSVERYATNFLPHVTIGRGRVQKQVDCPLINVDLPVAEVSELALYRSHLSQAGSRYEVLDRHRFSA